MHWVWTTRGMPHPQRTKSISAVRVLECGVERIKEVLGIAPRDIVLNVLMKVLFDRRVGLFVIALQGQEIVATLVLNLLRDGCLTAHRINRDNTTFDG